FKLSSDRYYTLYKKFLNHTISRKEYEELMEWVADERNDFLLRSYMEKIWTENEPIEDAPTLEVFKDQLQSRLYGGKLKIRKKLIFRIGYAAASVLALIILSYAGYKYFQNDSEIFQTAYGETLHVELEDGSQVILN